MPPLVSCLCVTEGRSAFMPWLLWGFERQTYTERELVVIDSSPTPWSYTAANVRVIAAAPGSNVPTKRNLALTHAQGNFIAWFDDDDWQHPERLQRLVESARDDRVIVGSSRSWFIDLFAEAARAYDGHGSLIFNTALFRTEVARSVRFNEDCRRASDTPWLRELRQKHREAELQLADDCLTLWLCHDQNISNPRHKRQFSTPLEELKQRIGSEAWADTSEQLKALRDQLPSTQSAVHPLKVGKPSRRTAPVRQHTEQHSIAYPEEVRPTATPMVTKAHRANAAARVLANNNASKLREIHPVVLISPTEREATELLLAHWQRQLQLPVFEPTWVVAEQPTQEVTELIRSLSDCAAEYLLVLRPRVLFCGSSARWLYEGQKRLKQSPEVVQITAHPGKPQGPLGTPRSMPANTKLGWDGRYGAFRWNKPPEAYFLARQDWLVAQLRQCSQGQLTDAIGAGKANHIALAVPTVGCFALEFNLALKSSQLHSLERFERAQLVQNFVGKAFYELPVSTTSVSNQCQP